MKKCLWIIIVILALAAAAILIFYKPTEEVNANVFIDEAHGVSFSYPLHWDTRSVDTGYSSEEYYLFAANFDYFDGLAESSVDSEYEGRLIYRPVESPGGLTLENYHSDIDFSEWKVLDIDGHVAYLSGWEGVPSSGEQAKQLIVDLADEDLFLHLKAVRTGITDEEYIENVLNDAIASIEIE